MKNVSKHPSAVPLPPPGHQEEANGRTTVLLTAEEVAAKVGVAPTNTAASPRQRRWAYVWFRRLLAISQLLDPVQIPNLFVNYQCAWWKAISGNDKSSTLKDGGLAYDLLPPVTRWAVAPPLAHLYPRFHHGNVELRTKYLDSAMDRVIEQYAQSQQNDGDIKIRLVLMGGGYDLRSIRMAQRYQSRGYNMDLVEMDLPNVIEAKQLLFQRRLLRRRSELTQVVNSMRLFAIDLNDLKQVREVFTKALGGDDQDKDGAVVDTSHSGNDWFTVFVFEAVLIYLDDGVPSRLFSILSDVLRGKQLGGALCFADTLPNVEEGREEQATQELQRNGWDLKDWITKPGRTRHLGYAVLS